MIQQNDHFKLPDSVDLGTINPQIVTVALLAAFLVTAFALRGLIPEIPRRLRRPGVPRAKTGGAPCDPETQMRAFTAVTLEPVALLRREEIGLLKLLETTVDEIGAGHRVVVHANLAEMLRPEESAGTPADRQIALAALKSMSLDFAVIDGAGRLVAAIGYHGSAHYLSETYVKDSVKRDVVRRADLPYVEVAQNFDPAEISNRLRTLLVPPTAFAQREARGVVRFALRA